MIDDEELGRRSGFLQLQPESFERLEEVVAALEARWPAVWRAHGCHPVHAVRVAAASLFLMPLAFTKLKELQPDHYWKLFVSGLLGIFFPAFLFVLSLFNARM